MAELENCNRKRAYLDNDFFWPLYRLSFTWNCGCLALKKGTNLLFKEKKGKRKIGSGFPPPPPKKKKNVTFLVSGTLLGLFRLLIQNEVSLERFIFADALLHPFRVERKRLKQSSKG